MTCYSYRIHFYQNEEIKNHLNSGAGIKVSKLKQARCHDGPWSQVQEPLQNLSSPKNITLFYNQKLGITLDPNINYLLHSLKHYIPNKPIAFTLIDFHVKSSPEQTNLSLEELMSSLSQVAGGV